MDFGGMMTVYREFRAQRERLEMHYPITRAGAWEGFAGMVLDELEAMPETIANYHDDMRDECMWKARSSRNTAIQRQKLVWQARFHNWASIALRREGRKA